MGMVNYDGAADGAVEMGTITADTSTGAEDFDGAATAATQEADSATQPQDASANGNNAVQWDGSQWTLKYRDKPVVPQSRDELIKWAQLGYNNDQRMRNLDQKESKLSEMEQQLAQVKQLSERLSRGRISSRQFLAYTRNLPAVNR